MALENLIPSAPSGNLVNWAIAIAAFAIVIYVTDQYFGGGNLFGFRKPKATAKPDMDYKPTPTKPGLV